MRQAQRRIEFAAHLPDVAEHGCVALEQVVRSLEADRQTLLLMKFQGLSNAEIGASLGRSEGAVKSLYHRTLADLRNALEISDQLPAPAAAGDEGGHTA